MPLPARRSQIHLLSKIPSLGNNHLPVGGGGGVQLSLTSGPSARGTGRERGREGEKGFDESRVLQRSESSDRARLVNLMRGKSIGRCLLYNQELRNRKEGGRKRQSAFVRFRASLIARK